MSPIQTDHVESCPACEADEIDYSLEEFDGVCTTCGLVIHDSTAATAPDWSVIDDTDNSQEDENWLAASRVRNATEQQLTEAFKDLETVSDELELSHALRRSAAEVYCKGFLAGTTDGRDTTTVVAACVRISSLEGEQPIPASRLIESTDVDEQRFYLGYSALCDELERTPQTPKPESYLPFVTRDLSLDDEQLVASTRILEDIGGDQSLVGKDPAGIAGAAIYLTAEEITQQSVADASGVSTETIRQRVAQLRKVLSDD